MNSRTGKPTITDIASAAGVSKATVSRFINGRTDLMSESTRERIRAVIEVANYQPSDIARSLKSKRTNLVGILVADLSNPFSSAILESIGDCLTGKGYVPLFADCAKSPEKEREMVEMFLSKDVTGLLVNTTSYNNDHLIRVACSGVPVVLCDRYVRNYNFNIVTSQSTPIVLSLVQHLKEQGFTRPVLFTQRWENNSSRIRRRNSFIYAVQKIYGYDPTDDVYVVDSQDAQSAGHQLEEMMASLRPGDIPAVMGINSVTTLRAYKAIRQAGLKIPREIGVCGPEDWNWESEMNWPMMVEPSITTFSLPAKEMGLRSAQLLIDVLENPSEPKEIKLPCELLVRNSTMRLGK